MKTFVSPVQESFQKDTPEETRGETAHSLRFDWVVAVLLAIFIGGAYLDSWAHNHLPEELETFFTPWHAVLYSGFFLTAGYHLLHLYRRTGQGLSIARAMPRGYGLSLLGIFIFLAGGIGDMFWHETFGIEVSIEGMISPPHLLLISGVALICGGPLRAAWQRPVDNPTSWRAMGPAMLSTLFTLALFTLVTQFAYIVTQPGLITGSYPTESVALADFLGVAAALLTTILWMSAILLLIRRWWRLPLGAVTLVLTGNVLMMVLTRYRFVADHIEAALVAALVAGICGDLLLRWLAPSPDRSGAYRLFAAAVPVIFFGGFFGLLIAGGGIRWSVHVWTGVIALTGLTGLLVSVLLFLPGIPSGNQNGNQT